MATAEAPTKMINRNPFCPVRLEPWKFGKKQTDKVMVVMENEQGEFEPLPGVNVVHGTDYALVPNQQVYDLVGDVLTRSGHTFQPVPAWGDGHSKPIHWDGKRFSAKWFTEDLAEDIGGSALALGVEAVNSYDGSQEVGVRFFAMHCLCSNQCYMHAALGNFVFRHTSRDAGVQLMDNVAETIGALRGQTERFLKTVPLFRQLRDKKYGGFDGFLKFRSRANKEFWSASRDALVLDELAGEGLTRKLGIQQLPAGDRDNYWGLLNAYTAVCTHKVGGFNGADLSDNVTTLVMETAGLTNIASRN